MPFTYREYPIMELALNCVNKHDTGLTDFGRRAVTGDITCARKAMLDVMVALPDQTVGPSGRREYNTKLPYGYIGFMEMRTLVWVRVTGWDLKDYGKLTDFWDEGAGEIFEKRRYCVPLARLKAIYPNLDVDRCTDVNDFYQPFISVDAETGFILSDSTPIEISGLVFDKATGDYLL